VPTWTDIRLEIDAEEKRTGERARDIVRRKKLANLEGVTGRPLIVYATDFLNQDKVRSTQNETSITSYDKDGWVEVTTSLASGPLDVILHSPGGSPFMAEWVVSFLRSKFSPIRVIVPHSAKSAAAMIAFAADEIIMDERGELGPIDPQMLLRHEERTIQSPAQAILDQFERAKEEIGENPNNLPVWLPVLRQYGPSLLEEAQNAIDLAKELVGNWLAQYMFAGLRSAKRKAREISEWVGDHRNFKAHPRQVLIDDLISRDVRVVDLRQAENQELRDAVWDVWTTYRITFDRSGAYKIFENSRGEAFIRNLHTVALVPPGTQHPLQATPSRAERRREARRKK
jgi:hypothetical protein